MTSVSVGVERNLERRGFSPCELVAKAKKNGHAGRGTQAHAPL